MIKWRGLRDDFRTLDWEKITRNFGISLKTKLDHIKAIPMS